MKQYPSVTHENTPRRLAVLISSPIHYLIALFKLVAWDKDVQSIVYFCSDWGIRSGIDVTFGKVVKWYDESILDGLPHQFIRNWSRSKVLGGFFSVINPGIFGVLVRGRFDALMMHGWQFFSSWLAVFAALITRTPILMRGENPLHHELLKSALKRRFKKLILGRILFKWCAAILYIGVENKKFYSYYGVPDSKLFFCPYAVDNDRFSRDAALLCPTRNDLRRQMGVPENRCVVLFLAKLTEKKRPFDLLAAYERLPADIREQAALVFVADGPLREELELHAAKIFDSSIHFLGFGKQSEISRYYAIADIFVLPSGAGETWGLVVNEAMNFGLPIIVSDMVGCGPDLVKHGENGYVFPVGDISQLSGAIGKLITNPETRERFGAESRNIIQRYSFEGDVRGIKQALQSI